MGLGTGIGMPGMSGGEAENLCVPRSEDVDVEELDVEKSIRSDCGVEGAEDPVVREVEGGVRWRVGTPSDLLRLCKDFRPDLNNDGSVKGVRE